MAAVIQSKSINKAYQEFISFNNDKLKLLSPMNDVSFTDDMWQFTYIRSTNKSDFSCFHREHTKFSNRVSLIFNNEMIEISIIELAKFLWLFQKESKATSLNGSRIIDCLAVLFSYLKKKEVELLSIDELVGLYADMLTVNASGERLTSRLSAPAFNSRLNVFDVKCLLRQIKTYDINVKIIPNTSLNKYSQALNSACKLVMDCTLSDYRKGGTFNFLGLDVGRHYIDYCSETFENNFTYAAACMETLNDIVKEVNDNIGYKHEGIIKRICAETLMGKKLQDVNYGKKSRIVAKKTLTEIFNRTLSVFCRKYNHIFQQADVFKLDSINEIVKILELPDTRFDNQEFVRAMLFTRYYGEEGKSRIQILTEFQASLASEKVKVDWGVEQFDIIADRAIEADPLTKSKALELCNKHYQQCEKLSSCEWEEEDGGLRKLQLSLLNVESAGVTSFVGITGWRSSEFGFPLNSIVTSVNQDIHDSTYTPYRFHVNWVVPKTSGKTPLNREISLASYLLALQLAKLNTPQISEPCLYSSYRNKRVSNISEIFIDGRVGRLWLSFCHNYRLFKELDELKDLQSKNKLSKKEKRQFTILSARYDMRSSKTVALQAIRNKLSIDYKRYLFVKIEKNYSFKKQLERYRNGNLNVESCSLIEEYLSDGTQMAIKDKSTILDKVTVKNISSEFLEGAVFPTPHALRHMWAEAVLRRYRGDVGKYIRANFKHLNESFFMAYLRDKETNAVYEVAQRNVINSVVRSHLLSMKDNKREYSGGFDSYLSKVINITKIISHDQYIETAKAISEDRVISLKANAWSTCLLREGTNTRAKCSEDGIPQRHNASPKFCLGCINANVSEGNFNGIVVYTQPEVNACRNPELPDFVKASCLEVLKPALIQVKKLRKNSGNMRYDKFISHLTESIVMAQKAISRR